MHKAIAFAVSAFLLSAPLAHAQTAIAPVQSGETPPESRIAAATDLLAANGTLNTLGATFDAVAPQQRTLLKRQLPNLSDETVSAVVQKIRDVIFARQDELLRLYAIEYARHFSEQELHDLAAFYRSDLGKKYIAEVPVLIKETSPVATRWLVGVIAQEQQKILDSLPKPDKKT